MRCGAQGGFGSLLRGAGKGGKITNNDDACRDLSGRRMRVANAETKLTEWQARVALQISASHVAHGAHSAALAFAALAPTDAALSNPVLQARAKERELEKLAEAHVRKVTKEESKAAEAASAAAESLRLEREQTAAALAGAVDRGLVEAEKLRVRMLQRVACAWRACTLTCASTIVRLLRSASRLRTRRRCPASATACGRCLARRARCRATMKRRTARRSRWPREE